MRLPLLVLGALPAVLTACVRHAPLSPRPVEPAAAVEDAGIHHTVRLGWSAWRADGTFAICGRRTNAFEEAGSLRGCLAVRAPQLPAMSLDWTKDASFVHDATPPDRAPGSCRVLLEDIVPTPLGPPARTTLVSPRQRLKLAEWLPAATIDGDYFTIEASFSPDGRWLALARLAIGIGEDRTVDVVDVELQPAPPCP